MFACNEFYYLCLITLLIALVACLLSYVGFRLFFRWASLLPLGWLLFASYFFSIEMGVDCKNFARALFIAAGFFGFLVGGVLFAFIFGAKKRKDNKTKKAVVDGGQTITKF